MIGTLSLPKFRAEFLEKSGLFVTPSEKHVAIFRILKKSVDSSNTLLAGRDVIEGREDAVALNGIDRWLGGVHLVGQNRSPWRWDGWRETLVS